MGKNNPRKAVLMKRMIDPNDARVTSTRKGVALKAAFDKQHPKLLEARKLRRQKDGEQEQRLVEMPQVSSSVFFEYNSQLGPPFHILMDTNFLNHSISNKLDVFKDVMNTLVAKCIPYVTDCVIAELEKTHKFNLALRLARDPRIERLVCTHKGTYADDCLVNRVTQHKCYIVGTNDKMLKQRIRKIPGVPILTIQHHRYIIERMPDRPTDIPFKKAFKK
eukprot:Filipodium_phascolosomae@DN4691_c0_g1_i1.p1